jgi:secreted PhoX family phosphatase
MTVTAGGGLLLAEDEASTAYSAEDVEDVAPDLTDVNRLIGITPAGEAFKFAVNVFSGSEMAGVCFSPDGETLFVNIFGDSAGGSRGRGHDLRDHRALGGRAAVSSSIAARW